ncbi:MAG: saccharopine dehydrogenase NADP-binding domain-containing protein [Anaerolineae bacterium]
MTTRNWMLYGAYGYTGQLLAEEAVKRGHRPLLAGRDESRLKPLAERLGLDYVAVALDDREALHAAVRDVSLVLHAAGPYIHTGPPMLEACIAGVTNYLDITGEIAVLELAFQYSQRAWDRGIAIIPGVGFDVVPTDCLAVYVARQVEQPQTLTLAMQTLARASAGTVSGMIETIARSSAGRVRRDGRLVPYPYGQGMRRFRFQNGMRQAVPIPWGDLVTAYHSTGIPNITTYMAYPPRLMRLMRGAGLLSLLLRVGPLRQAALGWVRRNIAGPDEQMRQTSRSMVYARVENARGEAAEAWLETVEAYRFTAEAGILAVEQTLARQLRGTLTPAQAFGEDFVLSVPETTRRDQLV